jgi:hypothetical protein
MNKLFFSEPFKQNDYFYVNTHSINYNKTFIDDKDLVNSSILDVISGDWDSKILDNYAFPVIVTDHVWFVGKINEEKIFTVQEYGQNVGEKWGWSFNIDYNVNENTPIMKFVKEDVIKIYFTKKYHSTYEKFKSEFEPYFRLEESPQVSNLLFESKGIQLDIWTLRTLEHLDIDILKNEERISHFLNGDSLIFFIRNIRNNKRNEFVWEQLKHLYKDSDYVDCDFEKKDVEFLSRLTNNFPDIIENLKHLKLNGQIQLIKKMFNIWKDDPIIAISVLEKHKLTPDMDISEQDLLLLELSVRKNIVIDNSTKLNKVLFFEKDSVNLNKNLDEFIF